MRDDFRDIAQRAPGFAGLFVDEGELVINTTSPALSPIVRSEVSRWLAGIGRTDLATRTAVARRVAHDYTRLVAAFETAAATAARIPGVNSFWIDDRENEVGIGVNNSGVASVVSQAVSTSLANASPEVASVSIAVRVMPIRDLGLQTTFVSLGGGIQIQEWNGDECTIGFVGWRNTSPGSGSPDLTYRIVTTASHCTSSQTTMNSDLFGQPNPLRIVADEVAEATVYPSTNPYCAAKSYPQCRFADVAILKVRDSIASIAGSAAISTSTSAPNDPPFSGWQAVGGSGVIGVLVGETVTKVGRTTGQTSGVVNLGCLDVQSSITPGLWTLCAMRAAANADHGDSGAPVFMAQGGGTSSPRPAGVLFSGTTNITVFSPISMTEAALGYGVWFYAW